jgi:hypothetical protein
MCSRDYTAQLGKVKRLDKLRQLAQCAQRNPQNHIPLPQAVAAVRSDAQSRLVGGKDSYSAGTARLGRSPSRLELRNGRDGPDRLLPAVVRPCHFVFSQLFNHSLNARLHCGQL